MKVSDVVYIFEKFMIFKQENEFENPHSKHLHKLMGLSKVVQKERFKKFRIFLKTILFKVKIFYTKNFELFNLV